MRKPKINSGVETGPQLDAAKFMGYRRPDGTVGVRNYVAIISTVGCANEITLDISSRVIGTIPITHKQGCPGVAWDLDMTMRTLVGLGRNPNIAAVLLVGLGCESVDRERVKEQIAKSGKPVELISAQETGGGIKTTALGVEIAAQMVQAASEISREEFGASQLIVGAKCGSSDATSGISANRAVGNFADIVVNEGGAFVFGELADILGNEQNLANRAIRPEVGQALIDAISNYLKRGMSLGFNLVGAGVTTGNKKGGITTVVEKSSGAVVKAGTTPLKGVITYGDAVTGGGLHILTGSARGAELLTGEAAAGCQIGIWTTGRGALQGHPLMPVIKVTGNIDTWNRLRPNMDFNASGIIAGTDTVEEVGKRLFEEVLKVASGKLTRAEILHYDRFMDIDGFAHVV